MKSRNSGRLLLWKAIAHPLKGSKTFTWQVARSEAYPRILLTTHQIDPQAAALNNNSASVRLRPEPSDASRPVPKDSNET